MGIRPALRAAHLWAGLVLSLVLVVLGVTGSALVYKDAWWRLVYPELREPAGALAATDHAAAVAAAQHTFGDELRSVKFPEPGVAAYHLYLVDGEAFLSVDDHRVIDRWRPTERATGFLFDLHAHLLAGETGEKVGGVLGLVGAFLVLSGVVLWWPARKRFRVRTLLPTGLTRRRLLPSHRDLGLLAAPLLLILLVTASGIVFYGVAGALLNGLLPGEAPVPEAGPTVAASPVPPPAGANLLARAADAFPDSRLVFYYPPREGNGVHGFRIKQACEVHPNGRSYLYTDARGTVLRQVDACAQPAGQRALYSLYPLHAGKLGSGTYKFLTFLGGFLLALLSATGAAAYLARLRDGRVARRAIRERVETPWREAVPAGD